MHPSDPLRYGLAPAVAVLLVLGACGDDAVVRRPPGVMSADAGGDEDEDAAAARPDAFVEPADANTICARVEVAARRVTPEVTIIVDQSGSMNDDLSRGVSRWEAVHRVLTGPDGLVTATDGIVRYGVALYSDTPGGSRGCPIVTAAPAAIDNHPAIEALLARSRPLGETPTGHAIEAILDGMMMSPDESRDPRLFVLATDGAPDRCGAPNGHDATSRRLSVEAIERAFTYGIRTYVIGVGEGAVAADHLAELAAAGQGGAASPFYEAGSVTELADALRGIVRGSISCTLELEGRIEPDRACDGEVLLNGIAVPCEDPDGWRVVDESHIELVGASCDALTEREGVSIEASFPCDVILY
ncbi:MAG: vWA domain-containing protein [Deltaproteobacteria bacterium]|jgi:hypothetical protein